MYIYIYIDHWTCPGALARTCPGGSLEGSPFFPIFHQIEGHTYPN